MPTRTLGVVIVAFNSADVILDCLESLLASRGVCLQIVVVDNGSTDGTVALLRDWAAGRHSFTAATDIPFDLQAVPKPLSLEAKPLVPESGAGAADHSIMLLDTGINAGFAAGVNLGLAWLAGRAETDRFWVLNPDSVAAADTAAAFASCGVPQGGFALMGGRVLYLDHPEVIQIDGGTINRRTGITGNLGLGALDRQTPTPRSGQMDFITGASMVVSRTFYDRAGPMPEDYFLYYEEVDWAMRRKDLPLVYCPGANVYHRAGTAIGSPTIGRPATPFSLYFKHRARLRFMRRYYPRSLPIAYAYSLAKAAQLLLQGYPTEARTLLGASFGRPPSAEIRARLAPEAAELAFGQVVRKATLDRKR